MVATQAVSNLAALVLPRAYGDLPWVHFLSLAFWLPWMLWWTSIGAREARHTAAGSAPS